MPKGKFKRLRQYAKVFRYCHKRLNSRHVKTRYEYELLVVIRTRALISVFNSSNTQKAELKWCFGQLNINYRGLNNDEF